MSKKISYLLVIVLFCAFTAKAQQEFSSLNHKTGVVRIIADTQLVNDIKPAVVTDDGPQMYGYRIQVYQGPDRDAAQKIKTEIAIGFGAQTYLIYESPYFKVRVGDYRSRVEAQQMLHTLKQKYTDILLVPGLVNLPELK